MLRSGSFLLALAASLGCASPQAATTGSGSGIGPVGENALEARLDGLLKPLVGKTTPGIVLVVQQRGKTLYRKAHGSADLAGKKPLTPETPMRIASLTKAFTSVVIQGLAGEGRLGLDDPVAKHLPTLQAAGSVTLRQMLTMTSGLADYTSDLGMVARMKSGKPGGPADVLAWVQKRKLDFAPGAKFAYSNTNYVLLGLVAEKAGGARLADLYAKRIFSPLGMRSSHFPTAGTSTPGEAQGARRGKDKLVPAIPLDMGWPGAAGSIVASADDLARWLDGIASARVLSEQQRADAFTPVKLNDGTLSFYGFGWGLGTRGRGPLIAHGGGIDGFSSHVAYLPATDVRVVILANGEDANVSALQGSILDALEGKAPIAGIADADPKLTARLRTVVERMLKGERDAAEFDPGFVQAVPDATYRKTGTELAGLGALEEFALIRDETKDGLRTREYRMRLGDASLTAIFNLSREGKIAGFRLR